MAKNEYGEKLDSNGYAPSILHDKPVCLICGRYGTARHEVYFGSAYRAKSKCLGLWVTLCHGAIRTARPPSTTTVMLISG